MSREEDEAKVWYKGRFLSVGEVRREKRLDVLNDTDLRVLKALLEKDEPVNAEELAEKLGMTKSYVYILVNKRLTPKYTVKIGERRFLVGLTEEGVKAARAA